VRVQPLPPTATHWPGAPQDAESIRGLLSWKVQGEDTWGCAWARGEATRQATITISNAAAAERIR
jgi:hypothetical protein